MTGDMQVGSPRGRMLSVNCPSRFVVHTKAGEFIHRASQRMADANSYDKELHAFWERMFGEEDETKQRQMFEDFSGISTDALFGDPTERMGHVQGSAGSHQADIRDRGAETVGGGGTRDHA